MFEKDNKRNNKGFTLAEMLIVVAIIGLFAGILTTVISDSLERAREMVDLANIRAAFTELSEYSLSGETSNLPGYIKYKKNGSYYYTFVKVTQKQKYWQSKNIEMSGKLAVVNGATVNAEFAKNTERAYKVTVYTDTTASRSSLFLVNLMTISNTSSVHDNDMYYKTTEYVRAR